MDTHDLFLSCRRGDLMRVRTLVEKKEIDVNVRDKWDSTPLYYACLCGHREVVLYLLEIGARCEANTFDGERCLYGALNDDIRHLLRNYKVITTSTIRRDVYQEFLRRLLDSGMYSDVVISIHGHEFRLHRCILCARSDHLLNLFTERWTRKKLITINKPMVTPEAFRALTQYLYTGGMEIPIDAVEDVMVLANHCKLSEMRSGVEDALANVEEFRLAKPGAMVTTLVVEGVGERLENLRADLGVLGQQGLPENMMHWIGGDELPLMPYVPAQFVDVIFRVNDFSFHGHKAFFCARSEYFQALVNDHFGEAERNADNEVPVVITLHSITPFVFASVHGYLYENDAKIVGIDHAVEVLAAADQYLLPGLKRLCGAAIAAHLNVDNVCDAFSLSRLFCLPRLENACCEYMAANIEVVISRPEFKELVVKDAAEVQKREDTDSIDIIDDIRHLITCDIRTLSHIDEADEKLRLIDSLLEDLGLDA
ncbi:unnamed protein product [Notodromas monacha]|uniref:BTB domain-containing protein n=1 Tax=Notodromas monacha TaxID=399045 RepID=A0A7R9GDY5_9CRUS|nr:unnamed protein product [Notodromas monacha]CAG0917705.1 unnamed protein product [Notodromas monacha]